jgi:hypothetical protein
MDRARVEELWSRFLTGGALPPGDEEELADALEADPRLLAELSQDLKLDGSLRGLGHVRQNEDEFVDSFSYRLRTERDGTRFIATVKQKMKRTRRPPTRRWEATAWPAARVGFAAAVVIAVLVLILAASSPSRKAETPSVRRPTEKIERPEPTPPVPVPETPRPVPPPVDNTPLTPKSFPTPVEKKEDPAPPPPPPVIVDRDRPATSTVNTPRALVAVGTFGRVNGDVLVSSADGKAPAKAGQKLFAGQAVESTGAKSGAQVQFADGTRIELGPDTTVSDVSETRGKRIVLARGALTAEVTKQPADQPMIVSTPHGEAKVLGTVFRLSVEAASMRLDVKEGRVRLTRSSDSKAVDVPAGCFASAGPEKGDLDLNADNKVTVSFQDGVSPTPRYSGTADATIVEAAKLAEKNTGVHNQLWVDGDTTVGDDRYVLLRWDLAGLPPRVTVLSATLEISVTNDSKGTTFDVFELKREWAEKEVTWKFAGTKAPWQTPGAQGAQDRAPAVLGVLSPRQPGIHSVKFTPDGVAAVQAWLDAPATNHGLIIANPDNQDAIGFHSREASLPANRPRLNITFVPRSK